MLYNVQCFNDNHEAIISKYFAGKRINELVHAVFLGRPVEQHVLGKQNLLIHYEMVVYYLLL